MALSMDEQRMLAEIEARLSAEDPGLAARLSSFRRPSPAAKLRSPRGRIVGSLFAVALAVVISLMVYAMIPFRAQSPGKQTSTPVASGNPAASAPVRPPVKPTTATTATTKTGDAADPRHTATSGTAASGTAAKDKTSAGKTSTNAGTSTSAAKTNTTSTTKTGTSTTTGNS